MIIIYYKICDVDFYELKPLNVSASGWSLIRSADANPMPIINIINSITGWSWGYQSKLYDI